MATTKNASKKNTTAKKATSKTARSRKATKSKEDLVVFAFRLTEAERDAIHKTAGPARASRYVRRVAAAFAKQDEGAFKAVLKEAKDAGR